MRAPLLLVLMALPASAQVFPRSGGMCSLDGSQSGIATYFRATTTTATGYQCDAVLTKCVDFGPCVDCFVGTNVSGEIVFGRTGFTAGVWRFWGTAHASQYSATNITATNVLTYNAALDQGTNAFMRNENAGKPVLVSDPEGLRVSTSTSLPACTAAMEGTFKPLGFAAASATRTRACFCTSDNEASPLYRWVNLASGAVGTNDTECPL